MAPPEQNVSPDPSKIRLLEVKPWWRVTFLYVAFGILWILLSDVIFGSMIQTVADLTFLQVLKGWIFVALSGLLVLRITKEAFDRQLAEEQAQLETVRRTVSHAHHILLNYLNQMQLVTMEAERCPEFNKETLAIARQVSDEATRELLKLHELQEGNFLRGHSGFEGVVEMEKRIDSAG